MIQHVTDNRLVINHLLQMFLPKDKTYIICVDQVERIVDRFRMKRVFAFLVIFVLANGAPQRTTKIIGGHPVDIADFPYQVSVRYFSSHMCGGVNLAPFYILTGARCADSAIVYLLTVRVGSSYHASGGLLAPVSNVHVHPQYDEDTYDFDIAILQLAVGLGSGIGVSAVTLPNFEQEIPKGTTSIVSGWGIVSANVGAEFSPQLQAADVPIVDWSECRETYVEYGSDAITPQMLCAGIPDGSKGPCQGDSGTPLVVEGGILVGIFSWGAGCGRPDFPAIYSNVVALRSFIKDIADV